MICIHINEENASCTCDFFFKLYCNFYFIKEKQFKLKENPHIVDSTAKRHQNYSIFYLNGKNIHT